MVNSFPKDIFKVYLLKIPGVLLDRNSFVKSANLENRSNGEECGKVDTYYHENTVLQLGETLIKVVLLIQ